jgi:hypothetical protein
VTLHGVQLKTLSAESDVTILTLSWFITQVTSSTMAFGRPLRAATSKSWNECSICSKKCSVQRLFITCWETMKVTRRMCKQTHSKIFDVFVSLSAQPTNV